MLIHTREFQTYSISDKSLELKITELANFHALVYLIFQTFDPFNPHTILTLPFPFKHLLVDLTSWHLNISQYANMGCKHHLESDIFIQR